MIDKKETTQYRRQQKKKDTLTLQRLRTPDMSADARLSSNAILGSGNQDEACSFSNVTGQLIIAAERVEGNLRTLLW